MAKGAKINTDLGGLDENKFYVASKLIVNTITFYASDFTFLPTPVSALAAELVIYDTALTAIDYPLKSTDIKESRKRAQKILTKNGNVINTTADGDITLLKKSAYPMQKANESQGILGQTELTIEATNIARQLDYSISFIEGYGIRYGIMTTPVTNMEVDESKWTFYYCAQREGTMDGLESKVDFKYVSFAMGTDKTIVYSEVVIVSPK